MIGKVIDKRYEIKEKLGEGGMAQVYLGYDQVLGRNVAIKVLRPQFAADNDFIQRFRREAQSAASLTHPNVVQIYDVGDDGDIPYIVMEYVEGRDLKQILKELAPFSSQQAITIAIEICRALEAAHRRNLVHRDIKPHNILVTKDAQVKVTDFGIARAASTAALTQTGTIIGSVHYFSPEQAKGLQVGVSSDVYSLGVLIYEMVTGRIPFDAETPVAIALKHLQEDPVPPTQIVSNIDPRLERVILKALAKDQEERYSDASALLDDLKTIQQENQFQTTTVKPVIIEDRPATVTVDQSNNSNPQEEDTRIHLPTRAVKMASAEREDNPVPKGEEKSKPKRAKNVKGAKKTSNTKTPQNQKRGRVLVWFLIVMSFFGGLIYAVWTFLPQWLIPKEVEVPEITGKSLEEAKAILNESKLKLVIEGEQNSSSPVNTILRQTPEQGRIVRQGREIKVIVSIGYAIVEVPDLRNKSEREATLLAQQFGLEIGEITYEYRPDIYADIVVAQDPEPFSRVNRESVINLVLSTGSAPIPQVEVPDFRGIQLSEAQKQIEELGLVLGDSYPEDDDRFKPGEVIDQDLTPLALVDKGSTINLVYRQSVSSTQPTEPITPTDIAPTTNGAASAENWIYAFISIDIPPGPDQEVIIVVIDNISARDVYRDIHKGDSRILRLISGRGNDSMYQVWLGGELIKQGLIREVK
jgi:serine/threonine protein kinase